MKKIYTIDEIIEKSLPIAKRYKIAKLYVFGSYARDEATEESDIDILIDKGEIQDLIEYFGFVSALEEIFETHVDVVTTKSSDIEFLKQIKKEAILIYESKGQNSSSEDYTIL